MPRNAGHDYRERLGEEASGLSLVAYLSRRYAHSSRDAWGARIASGQVLLDAAIAGPETVLRTGQLLTWRRPAWDEPDAPGPVAVLYEDDDLIAVDKPAGLPTLPGAGFLEQTLLARVRERDPGASPLHRLGRWTSGVVLFARTPRARADLTSQWRERSVEKRYRALASGDPASDGFSIDHPIGPVPHPLLGSVHAVSPSGRASSSHVTVIERRGGGSEGFLCDVRIDTGRPHQIRIHLAAAGFPLVGDTLYPAGGVPSPDSTALPGDPGYHLHAAELAVRHPGSGNILVVASTPPPLLRHRTHPSPG